MTLSFLCLAALLQVGDPPRIVGDSRLRPFLELRGVRLSIRGFEPTHAHIIGGTGEDVETQVTGLPRVANEAIEKALWALARESLRGDAVPILPDTEAYDTRRPELRIQVSRVQDLPHDRFAVRVETSLLEPANLVRDGERVWVPTWRTWGEGFATPASLREFVEGYVRFHLKEFGERYRRAHPPGSATPSRPAP